MKQIILLTVFSIVLLEGYAQRVTDEKPYGLSDGLRMQPQNFIVLTAPNRVRIEKEDIENDRIPGPLRFAYPVQVNYTLENSGVWHQLDDGSRIWRLKVNIPGALSTNTYYDKFWLPEGSKFFV